MNAAAAHVRAVARNECEYPHAPRNRRRVLGEGYFSRVRLGGRSSRNAESMKCFEIETKVFSGCKSRDGNRRLCRGVGRRLRYRNVSNVADLAMLLVARLCMPVADRVRGQ